MANNTKSNQADAQFKKAQRAEDAKKGMADYEAELIAVRKKTERLRALRLERDAAEAAAAPPAAAPGKPAKKPAKKAAKSKTAAAPKLSEWLQSQKSSGRSS